MPAGCIAGEGSADVKEQLGHTSIKITVDIYGYLVPGFNQEAVNRLPWEASGNHSGKHEVEEEAYERANH